MKKGDLLDKITLSAIDIYHSQDEEILTSLDESPEMFVDDTVIHFIHRPGYSKLVDVYLKHLGNDRKAILFAHGDDVDGRWHYFSKGRHHSIQSWIRRHDKDYGLMMLHVCNPECAKFYSSNAAILAPNGIFSYQDHDRAAVTIDMRIPKIGFVDTYLVDYYTKMFEEKIKEKQQIGSMHL